MKTTAILLEGISPWELNKGNIKVQVWIEPLKPRNVSHFKNSTFSLFIIHQIVMYIHVMD